jgi:hypothetical protein
MLIKDVMTKTPVSCRPWHRLDAVAGTSKNVRKSRSAQGLGIRD